MNIGIDGRVLVGNLAGTGRYVYEICRRLDYLFPEANFYVFSSCVVNKPCENARWHYCVDSFPFASKLKPVIWLKLRCGFLARSIDLDIFWGTSHFLPFLNKKVTTILTVHDLVAKLYPNTLTFTHWLSHFLFFSSDILRANHVAVNSNGTGTRLFNWLGRKADVVVRPAISDFWGVRTDSLVEDTFASLNIEKKFILAVGTREPRKNLNELINAFIELKNSGSLEGYQLVIAGGKGWLTHELSNDLAKYSFYDIKFLGFVSDEALRELYTRCALFVFPSIYEGYGIPIIEAISSGANVLASDTLETREAGGEGASYFPVQTGSLQSSIINALNANSKIRRSDPPMWRTEAEKFSKLILQAYLKQ